MKGACLALTVMIPVALLVAWIAHRPGGGHR